MNIEDLLKNRQFILKLSNITCAALKHADDSLKKDKEIVKIAVTNSGYSLQYADDSLKKIKK